MAKSNLGVLLVVDMVGGVVRIEVCGVTVGVKDGSAAACCTIGADGIGFWKLKVAGVDGEAKLEEMVGRPKGVKGS